MGNPSPLWPHGDGGPVGPGPDDGVAPVWWVYYHGGPGRSHCWTVTGGNRVCSCNLS